MGTVRISEKYVKGLIARLKAWRQRPDALVFASFLSEQEIGWSIFKRIRDTYPQVRHEFEVACAAMSHRWVMKAIEDKSLTSAQEKVLVRYLRFYDLHTWDMELDARRAEETAKGEAIAQFVTENFKDAELSEPYKQKFEQQSQSKPFT